MAPLEYWKAPKPVYHHRRGKSSAVLDFTKGIFERGDHPRETARGDEKRNPFAELKDLEVEMADFKSPARAGTRTTFEAEEEREPGWWDVRYWGWKAFLGLGFLLVIIIVAIVVPVVITKKNNRYPTYTPLRYTLKETYSGETFFDNFNYFTGPDPAGGFVHYVDREGSQGTQYNLTYASASSAVLRVDTTVTNDTVPNASTGRFSARITSKNQYSSGLFIFDVKHSPLGCSTWPALWMTDPDNWPYNGEIDIMEAANVITDDENQMTLHTAPGCTMKSVKRKQAGSVVSTACNTTDNAGCGVQGGKASFGTTFNAAGGGVVAVELRTEGIRMWDWLRGAIPADVTAGTPDPSTWAEATADFPSTKCDIGAHFRNQSIVANIDICGDWAGATYKDSSCPGTCTDNAAINWAGFTDAYWEFGAFQIYAAA